VEKPKLNRNVYWTLICLAIWGFAEALWTDSVLAAYLYLMTDDTIYVGYGEAIMGFISLLTALPVGYVSDILGRAKIMKFGGICMFFAAAGMIYVVMWVGDTQVKDG
jgi:hypothetical protein